MESNTTEGVTITALQQDTANELNADHNIHTNHYASYAITSTEDTLFIDAGESVILDKIEIFCTNIRRTVAEKIAQGGTAVSFSLLGTDDLQKTWTILRNGNTVTDIPALSGTTTTGQWQQNSANVTITNTGNTSYRYYKLLPVNRSTNQELSLTLHKINLYKKVAAVQVDMSSATLTDSIKTAVSVLKTFTDTSTSTVNITALDSNRKTYCLNVDFGTGNSQAIDFIQLSGNDHNNGGDSMIQAKDGFVISASKDFTTWTPLFVSSAPVIGYSATTRSFDIAPEQPYRYYRLDIAKEHDTLSCSLTKIRFFVKSGRNFVSCLLPKCPHINSPMQWQCSVKITSAAVCGLPSPKLLDIRFQYTVLQDDLQRAYITVGALLRTRPH
jgi:hypothetical protein